MSAPTALRTLLDGIVDYAGLFPPAALGMAEAVAEYAQARARAHAWMLGRLVVPANRLDELTGEVGVLPETADVSSWRVSALVAADLSGNLDAIHRFNARPNGPRVDAIEAKVESLEQLDEVSRRAPGELARFIEIPTAANRDQVLERLATLRLRAKIRTGGITEGAFPSPESVASFTTACHRLNVAWKATAGLHHPMAGDHRLTYEPNSACGRMFGFLNVALGAAAVRQGMSEQDLARLLRETDPHAFAFDAGGATWRAVRLPAALLADTRRDSFMGFGSCSFREPVADLATLGWLTLHD